MRVEPEKRDDIADHLGEDETVAPRHDRYRACAETGDSSKPPASAITLIDWNSIPRTERYSLTLRQLVQCGCQNTPIGSLIFCPAVAMARLTEARHRGSRRQRHFVSRTL